MQTAQPSPSAASLQRFHRLPASLFALVAQFLPLPDKLLQLSHIARAFPPLTPQSFACDTLAWTPTLISRLTASPPPPLLSLLALVPRGLFIDSVDPRTSSLHALCGLLAPEGALPSPFSAL